MLIRDSLRGAPPLWNPPARTWYLPEELNGQNLLYGCSLTVSGLFHDVRSAVFLQMSPFGQKRRNTFCPNRIEVKVLQRHRKCAPERFLRRAALCAGAHSFSAFLSRLLLVLFLAKQEKYISALELGNKSQINFPFQNVSDSIVEYIDADSSFQYGVQYGFVLDSIFRGA